VRRPGKVLVCAHFGNSFCAEAAPERAPLGGGVPSSPDAVSRPGQSCSTGRPCPYRSADLILREPTVASMRPLHWVTNPRLGINEH
jgi:hypothetical protein